MLFGKNSVFVLIFFMVRLQAMEMPRPTIAIRGSDGGIIGVSKDVAMQVDMIRNSFSDVQEREDNEGEKESSFDASIVDFRRSTFLKIFSESEEQHEHLNIDTATLNTVFDCIKDKSNVERLNKEEVLKVFEVAHCLGVSVEVMQKLTQRASILISKKEFKDNSENPLYEMVKQGHYFTSIKTLFNRGILNSAINDARINGILDLREKNINTLEGIFKIGSLLHDVDVHTLILSGNKLTHLNMGDILEAFEGVKKVVANRSGIEEVTVTQKFAPGFILKLKKNSIEKLPADFHVPEQGKIVLKGNVFSDEIRHVALQALNPTFGEKMRPYLKSFCDPLFTRSILLYGGLVAIHPNNFLKIPNPGLVSRMAVAVNGAMMISIFYTIAYMTYGTRFMYKPGQVLIDEDDGKEKETGN